MEENGSSNLAVIAKEQEVSPKEVAVEIESFGERRVVIELYKVAKVNGRSSKFNVGSKRRVILSMTVEKGLPIRELRIKEIRGVACNRSNPTTSKVINIQDLTNNKYKVRTENSIYIITALFKKNP